MKPTGSGITSATTPYNSTYTTELNGKKNLTESLEQERKINIRNNGLRCINNSAERLGGRRQWYYIGMANVSGWADPDGGC